MSDYLDIQGASTTDVHDDTIQIAPELMGEGGLAVDHQNPSSSQHPSGASSRRTPPVDGSAPDGPSEGYPGFASSNARGGDEDANSQWDAAVYGASMNDKNELPAWANADYNYTTDPAQSGLSNVETTLAAAEHDKDPNMVAGGDVTESEGPKPKKRPRPSKPRQSKIDKEPLVDISDMIFENNDQDIRTGPVFVHAPPGTSQACIRCHRIKRKCDQVRPRCQGCSKADVACVYELSPATSLWLNQLKGDNTILSTQIASAHDRIAQLEALVTSLERNGNQGAYPSMDETYERQFDEITASQAGVTDFSALARTILAGRSEPLPSLPNTTPYPTYELAIASIHRFFETYDTAYPFLDNSQVIKDTDALYARLNDPEYLSSSEDDESRKGKEFILFLIVSLGVADKERTGEVEKGSAKAYREKALVGLSAAIAKGELLSVQALLLLIIHSLVVPSDISPVQILGHAQQAAISLNLHQRADQAKSISEEVQHRDKIFVSLFNLERVIAYSLHRPVLFADESVDCSASREGNLGHMVQLRRILGQIALLHGQGGGTDISAQKADLERQLHTWYNAAPRAGNEADVWAASQYNLAAAQLHLPSPSAEIASSGDLRKLYTHASVLVDILDDAWRKRSTLYNAITVYDHLTALIALNYAMAEIDSRAAAKSVEWRAVVVARLQRVQEIYEAISPVISSTKLKTVYETIYNALRKAYPDSEISQAVPPGTDVVPPISAGSNGNPVVAGAIKGIWTAQDGKVNAVALEELNAGVNVANRQSGFWAGL